eukprot:6436043-Prymnesium_polylepis.1
MAPASEPATKSRGGAAVALPPVAATLRAAAVRASGRARSTASASRRRGLVTRDIASRCRYRG